MSHEIRTPLSAVVGISDLLVQEDLTREQDEQVRMLQSSATALLGVIDDVLDFSKIESGHLTLLPTDLLVSELVAEVLGLFEPRARDMRSSLVAHVDAGLAIHADAGRLRQILVNLVGNALKFTSDGTVRVVARAVEGHSTQGETEWRIRFEVRDSGGGIEPDAMGAIFQAFTQVDDTAARHHGGVGLGLAICKTLVEAMDGLIEVQSIGKGTTFRFEIPLVSARGETQALANDEAVLELRGHVLLVEDEPVNRLVSSQVLLALGLKVTEATNGEEAVKRFEAVSGPNGDAAARFDLILMDCQMPIVDGYAATEEIRRREQEQTDGLRVPILALTAHAFEDDRMRCLEAGMDGYLSKPVRLETLGRQLSRWLPSA